MPLRPRAARGSERVRAAQNAARAGQCSAIDAALAQIAAAFDEAAAINDFKLKIERAIRLGPCHPALQARLGARAAMLSGRGLDGALVLAERWWRDERRAFAIASALGRGNRLPLDVLRELRLMLRLMGFKRMHVEFCAIAAASRGDEMLEAAE
jgi:hypothetical protein